MAQSQSSHAAQRRDGDDGDLRRRRRDEDYKERRSGGRRGSPVYSAYTAHNSQHAPSTSRTPRFDGEPGSTRWIESRAEYRKNLELSIWPASPPLPAKKRLSPAPKAYKRGSSSVKDDYDSRSRHKSKHRHRDDEDGEDRRRRKQRKAEKKEEKQHQQQRESSTVSSRATPNAAPAPDTYDDDIGPMPLPQDMLTLGDKDFSRDLLRGEGTAMAQYVQDGQRIPRRGEIGLESVEIDKFEQAGYVMSGNRHKRMNEVRVRKENEVYTAEEKRKMLKEAAEEKLKKENEIVASFKELVNEKLKPKPGSARQGG